MCACGSLLVCVCIKEYWMVLWWFLLVHSHSFIHLPAFFGFFFLLIFSYILFFFLLFFFCIFIQTFRQYEWLWVYMHNSWRWGARLYALHVLCVFDCADGCACLFVYLFIYAGLKISCDNCCILQTHLFHISIK